MFIKEIFQSRFCHCVVLTCFIVTAFSCKKSERNSNENSAYYMRFKINGTQVEYKEQIEGNFNKATSSQYNSSVAGIKELFTPAKNNMSLLLATAVETQTGITYTNYTTTASGMQKAKLANLVYIDENGKNYLSWMEEFTPSLPAGTEIKALITITSTTSNTISGTFSGVLYSEDYTIKLNITEGAFSARRVN